MPFIIGTAGHIDHGKTSLVRALTGQDTDRLKEEKERGISIELGFAHLDLPDGTRAGVVDVPGHERFIRTMLAGAHAMDLVLFTVAADDGVMPQTVEHLDIVHLLGIGRAIFVVTKADLATAERLAEVEAEIRRLARGTSVEGSPVVPFSCATGAGLERLLDEIGTALRSIDRTPPSGYFRLPVDRVFVLPGHGVVATGTALQGDVTAGDWVRCLPGGDLLRVRGLQVHGQPVSAATWGQRVALNLTGPQRPVVERGYVLCDERLTMVSDRFDASVEARPAAMPVRSHQRIRVHMGTAERLGRIVVLGAHEAITPGGSAFCQIVVSEPLAACRGDRFIVRDETAQRTLAGGTVLDPSPRAHRRREPQLDENLQALQSGNPAAAAAVFLEERDEFASTGATLHQLLNLRAEEVAEQLQTAAGIRVVSLDGDGSFTTERKWHALEAALVSSLAEFHRARPLEPGRDMEALREQLDSTVTSRMFRAFVERLEAQGTVTREGSLLRLPDHSVALREREQQAAEQITCLLAHHPLSPPDLPQLTRDTGIDRVTLNQVLRVLERQGSVVRVASDLYLLPDSIDRVVRTLREEWAEGDEITPAAFRDRFNTTRKYAIPLLEYLDQAGVTVRTGETRRLRPARSQVR